jgi:hypothetical protein
VALLLVAYWLQARSAAVSSDGASIILQAANLRHGNLLLRGWDTSDVSFYGTELVQYALLLTALPMSPGLVFVAGAMTYTILVTGAALLARGRATGREGVLRACAGAGIMLAPAAGSFTALLLHAPDHTGSAVPVLLAWLVIDRCAPRWYVPAAVCLLLTWGQAGDQLIEITGVAAIVVACGARSAHALLRRRRPGWFEPSLAAAAIASFGLAKLVMAGIRAAGGFTPAPVNTNWSGLPGLWQHAALTGEGLLGLFGASFWTKGLTPLQMTFSCLHLAGVALAVAGLALALRWFFRPDALLTAGLATAIILNVAAFMTSGYAGDILSIREAAAVLPFAAICAGRLLPGRPLSGRLVSARLVPSRPLSARPLSGRRLSGRRFSGRRFSGQRLPGRELPGQRLSGRGRSGWLVPEWLLVPVLAVAGTAYVAMLGVNAVTARPAPPAQSAIATWLASHHLTNGLATGYWLSNIVTVDTGGQVKVREVQVTRGAVTTPPDWEVNTSWYDPAVSGADFLLTNAVTRSATWEAQVTAVERDFGSPARIYHVDGFSVLTWHENLISALRPAPAA